MPEAPYHPTLDVYRDEYGNAITVDPSLCLDMIYKGDVSQITGEQAKAIIHALYVWQRIRYTTRSHYGQILTTGHSTDLANSANLTKSCLLGRLLYEGRPPMAEPPPVEMAAVCYHLVDPALCPACGGERAGPGVGRIIPMEVINAAGGPDLIEHLEATDWLPHRRCLEPWHTHSD